VATPEGKTPRKENEESPTGGRSGPQAESIDDRVGRATKNVRYRLLVAQCWGGGVARTLEGGEAEKSDHGPLRPPGNGEKPGKARKSWCPKTQAGEEYENPCRFETCSRQRGGKTDYRPKRGKDAALETRQKKGIRTRGTSKTKKQRNAVHQREDCSNETVRKRGRQMVHLGGALSQREAVAKFSKREKRGSCNKKRTEDQETRRKNKRSFAQRKKWKVVPSRQTLAARSTPLTRAPFRSLQIVRGKRGTERG